MSEKLPRDVLNAALAAYFEPPNGVGSMEAAAAVAYLAGREAALNVEEWQVVHTSGSVACSGCWSTCATEAEARFDAAEAVHEGTWGDVWIEHRRVGATDWERVPS